MSSSRFGSLVVVVVTVLIVLLVGAACGGVRGVTAQREYEGGYGTIEETPELSKACTRVYEIEENSRESKDDARCSFVRRCDGADDSTINYLALRFCALRSLGRAGATIVTTLIISVLILLYFYVLGDTSSEYFCPSLEEVSVLLHMTPTLVGVTLLPLGNGAPDVFAAFASFSGGGGGEDVGLSAILGAGVFVTSVVVGAVNICVPDTALDAPSFRRDVVTYGAVVVVVTIGVGVVGGINGNAMAIGLGAAMLSAYAVYGAAVVLMEVAKRRREQVNTALAMELLPASASYEPSMPTSPYYGDIGESEYASMDDAANDGVQNGAGEMLYFSADSRRIGGSSFSVATNPLASLPQWQYIRNAQSEIYGQAPISEMVEGMRPERPLWGYVADEANILPKLRRFTRVAAAVCVRALSFLMIRLPRLVTIPRLPRSAPIAIAKNFLDDENGESSANDDDNDMIDEEYDTRTRKRLHAFVSNFGFPLFFSWATGLWRWIPAYGIVGILFNGISIALMASVLLSLAALFSIPRDGSEPRSPLARAPWVFLAFTASIVWIYVAANELVAALVALGTIFRIRTDVLGLTVLAWGNSIGDALSNITIARGGGSSVGIDAESGARMAVAGCFAGPLFNLLFGLGGSLLIAVSSTGTGGQVRIDIDTPQLIITSSFLLLNVAATLTAVTLNGTRTSKRLGMGLIGSYITFLVISAITLVVTGATAGKN